ncbi:MAG: cytidylate kinase family protein [Candidatus Woesearchaeota archaeon]
MIISISGMPGAGKSTLAENISKKLGMKRYYIGALRRSMAKERGMTLDEFNTLGETDPSTDKEVDEYQEKLGKEEDNFVIEGRTSFFFIPHSIKIFLDVDLKEAARRIYRCSLDEKDQRNEKVYLSEDDVYKNLLKRIESDRKRYRNYYNIENCYDGNNFDFVIDTTLLTPEQVFEKTKIFVEKRF